MPSAVADTHALIWYLLDSPRLSPRAATALDEATRHPHTLGVSSISILEMIYLIEKGRIPGEVLEVLKAEIAQPSSSTEVIPLSYEIALAAQGIPRAQVPDMPDRIIAATALHLGLPLVSRDGKIQLTTVCTIW